MQEPTKKKMGVFYNKIAKGRLEVVEVVTLKVPFISFSLLALGFFFF